MTCAIEIKINVFLNSSLDLTGKSEKGLMLIIIIAYLRF